MALDTSSAIVDPAAAMKIDEDGLLAYLKRHIEGINHATILHARQFSHGQSNPTYLLEVNGSRFVLRKKPPGKVLASAHAVDREFRVLNALSSTDVPIPRALCLCEDASVIGTPFYVMQHVSGQIHMDVGLPGMTAEMRTAVYRSMAETLAKLHDVQPDAVGLGDYGRRSGYSARQVWRWAKQYKAQLRGPPLKEMVETIAWLENNIPASDGDAAASRIAHGDFRMDNLIYSSQEPDRVLAVLDWELSTIGHPFADLAYNCMPYHLPSGFPGLPGLPDPLPPGIPLEQEYVKWYCDMRGIAVPDPKEWAFYQALGFFRLAAILAGVGARAKEGNASSAKASAVGSDGMVQFFAERALDIIKASGGPSGSLNMEVCSCSSACSTGCASTVPSGCITPSNCAAAAPSAGLSPSPRAQELLTRVTRFMDEHVLPAEPAFEELALSDQRWTVHPIMEELKAKARSEGLWNLWISASMAEEIRHLLPSNARGEDSLLLGLGLSNLEYAFLAEQMGRTIFGSEVFNCSAPDTGNMEVLARYGSPEQQRQWLLPLLRGEIRSCFAMTEPAVASSDATNIEGSILRKGNEYVINGLKWWTSGAMDPRCKICIFMGKTDPTAAIHKQQSMILVPMDAPGVKILRPLDVFGYDDAPHGHAEVSFTDVRVPLSYMLLGEGRGFEIAQGRLGPGRLHHCMRAIGLAERAMELMAMRSVQRKVFGKEIARQGAFQKDYALRRIELDAARLVVLDAAHALDVHGNKKARGKIAAAKVLAPRTTLAVIDTAIQVYGGAGVSNETPLARMYAGARTLRIADGPDDVHLAMIAKLELLRLRSKL